jgi:hydrogenase expression/formation protein HypE
MLTILAPEKTTLGQLEEIMADASDTCRELGIEILGGHTEITDAVTRVVLSVTAIGKISKSKYHMRGLIRSGDSIIMTKLAGLEGTGIIACEKEGEVSSFLSDEEIRRASSMLSRISVVMESRIASRHGALQMHDITEGGVLGAVWEMCESVGLGCCVDLEKIHVDDVTRKICAHYGIDPLKLISSGSMLIAVKQDDEAEMMEALTQNGIECSKLGCFSAGVNKMIVSCGAEMEIDPPESDELYKVV